MTFERVDTERRTLTFEWCDRSIPNQAPSRCGPHKLSICL
jgi:hypothetical protein